MAAPTSTIVLTTMFVSINGVDLSAYCKGGSLEITPDTLEDTAMGATYHTSKPGLLKFKMSVDVFQRFDASLVNETIYPLAIGGTLFAAIIKAVSASATNNTFTLANAIVSGAWAPISGSVGTMLMAKLELGAGSGFTCTKS